MSLLWKGMLWLSSAKFFFEGKGFIQCRMTFLWWRKASFDREKALFVEGSLSLLEEDMMEHSHSNQLSKW